MSSNETVFFVDGMMPLGNLLDDYCLYIPMTHKITFSTVVSPTLEAMRGIKPALIAFYEEKGWKDVKVRVEL